MSRDPQAESRATRARSFGAVAADYDRYRPLPPEEALDWLLPSGCNAALDLGAGTGLLTRRLAARLPEVYAVDPDPQMRAHLAHAVASAHVLAGQAEAIPLPDGAVDAVLVSSAWHWMDPVTAVPEIARVLRPHGVFGLLWNSPDRSVPWVGELFRIGSEDNENDEQLVRRRRLDAVRLPDGAPFGPPETRVVTWVRDTTPADLRGLIGTLSLVITMPEPERGELLDRVTRYIAANPALAGREVIAVPMACRCWRAARL
jgi:SAM-dependent methyltransferase